MPTTTDGCRPSAIVSSPSCHSIHREDLEICSFLFRPSHQCRCCCLALSGRLPDPDLPLALDRSVADFRGACGAVRQTKEQRRSRGQYRQAPVQTRNPGQSALKPARHHPIRSRPALEAVIAVLGVRCCVIGWGAAYGARMGQCDRR